MPSLAIPIGSKISKSEHPTIEIQIPNTNFWISGKKNLKTNRWEAFLFDPQSNYKKSLRKNVTTKSFKLFSNIILKTPFPYQGKRAKDAIEIKKFIKNKTKTIK